MLGIYIVLMLGIGGVFSVIDMIVGGLVGALISQSAAMVLAAIFTLALSGPVLSLGWRNAIHLAGGRVAGRVWLPVVVLFVVGYPVVVQIAMATHVLLPMPESLARVFEELLGMQDQVLAALVLLTVIAPLVEEFICRGWLMPALMDRWSHAWAVAFTALIFGLIHLNPWQFFYAVYLGAWLGWVYVRTRSIWPCVAGHAVNNGLAWLASLMDPSAGQNSDADSGAAELLPWPVVLVSFMAATVCAGWLWLATRKDPRCDPQAANSVS
jgi:membrane protease YdiL (CAAX protease family)